MLKLSNYFDGKFHETPLEGRDSTEQTLVRFYPHEQLKEFWVHPVCFEHREKVVASANAGFLVWKKTPFSERLEIFERFITKLTEKKSLLIETLSLENGQPLKANLSELDLVLNQAPALLAEYAQRLSFQEARYSQALGPALFLSSFSRPLFFAQRFLLNNLLAGNSVIIKPSEKVSLTLQKMVECLHEAGFPPGVINLIHGDAQGETSRRLLREKSLKVLFFTGSNEVGITLPHSLSSSLSLTNKNIAILDKGFPQEKVRDELLSSAYAFAGQDCFSTALVLIPEESASPFISSFHTEAKKLLIGPPASSPEAFMGPLIDQQAMDNYILYMGMAKREGLQEIMRGKQIEKKPKGFYVSPSIHYCETFLEKSRFLQSDILGPNITFISYRDLTEAISIANRIELPGLVSLYTQNESTIQSCRQLLEAKFLCLNKPIASALEHKALTLDGLPCCLRVTEVFS